MMIPLRFPKTIPLYLAKQLSYGLVLTILGGCTGFQPEPSATTTLYTIRRETAIVSSPRLMWPDFFLAKEPHQFLWGERGEIYQIETSGLHPRISLADESELIRGLDHQIGAAQSPSGTLAILDSSGRIAIGTARSKQRLSFPTSPLSSVGALAISKTTVYVLHQGDYEEGTAVVAYNLDGKETGHWGRVPPDGVLQTRLKGGGIAACPDGGVYYSYINSARIFRLRKELPRGVEPMDLPKSPFQSLPAYQIREAYREARRTKSVTELVKLGLNGSRVMALICSPEGLLVRQVANPGRTGSRIEVWDPMSNRQIGQVPVGGSVLLAVRDRTFFLGSLSENREFRLESIKFRVETHQINSLLSKITGPLPG